MAHIMGPMVRYRVERAARGYYQGMMNHSAHQWREGLGQWADRAGRVVARRQRARLRELRDKIYGGSPPNNRFRMPRNKSFSVGRKGRFRHTPFHARKCVELKYFDTNVEMDTTNTPTDYAADDDNSICLLNTSTGIAGGTTDYGAASSGIQIGSGVNQRVGARLYIWSILVKINMFSANTGNRDARVVLIYDKESNGTRPTWADVFEQAADQRLAVRNLENSKRFMLLFDRHMTLSYTGNLTKDITIYKKFKQPLRVDYDHEATGTTSGDSTQIKKGNLWLFFNPSSTACGNKVVARVRYTD